MPAIAIQGSLGSGHGSFPPRPSVMGDPLLTIAGTPVQVDGDVFPNHTDGHTSHPGTAVSSRPWFTVNGKGVCAVGDVISCGSVIVTGNALVEVG
ncbi:TPA: PAAR domain-containing protein [Enterobacter cloacae]